VAKSVYTRKQSKKTRVSLIKIRDRAAGIKRAIGLLKIDPLRGQDVLLQPNFNTADPFPGSTHNDTLPNLIIHLKSMDAKSIIIGERSGPRTQRTYSKKGNLQLV